MGAQQGEGDADGVALDCNFTIRDATAPLGDVMQVSSVLPAFEYLPNDWTATTLTLQTASNPAADSKSSSSSGEGGAKLIGVDGSSHWTLHTDGSNVAIRRETLGGFCLINGQRCVVANGGLTYTIQLNDSDVEPDGLAYNCSLTDGAANTQQQSGLLRHQQQQIDGSLPIISNVTMVFSTEKPARVDSVISIALQSEGLKTGYSGNCSVNGVVDRPLLEAEDDGVYMTQYTVAEGDRSVSFHDEANATMTLSCWVTNAAGSSFLFEDDVALGFEIDAQAPQVASTSLLFSSDHPAHEGSIIEIQVTLTQDESDLSVANPREASCLVNNVSVASSFSKSAANAFVLTYVVGTESATWKAGQLPVKCVIRDAAGNTATVTRFTDDNTLFAREFKPEELVPAAILSLAYFPDKLLLLSFLLVAVASQSISKVFPSLGLPRITGYLLTGIVAGPFVLNLLSSDQLRQLRIVDELALAYISITAGSKLHWRHMRPLLKSIAVVALALTVVEYLVGTLTVAVLAGFLDFLQDTTDAERYAIALLAGCMMIARSPSSALAVIEETKASGRFTTLVFAVTVSCDVLVIFLFNVNSVITESFLTAKRVDEHDVLRLALQLCGSIGVGAVTGKLMALVVLYRPSCFRRKRSRLSTAIQVAKQFLLLLYGWLVFVLGHTTHPYLEPLLCCMVSGAVMWNCSPHPDELALLLARLADVVYVCFFTLTGAALQLDMLAKALALSLILCATRIAAIFVGSFLGGLCVGEPPQHARVAWMAYLTQAGVTLGLAKQIQLLYPGWGSSFSTMIVAVVICNQLLGPPLMRFALRRVGDAKKPAGPGQVDGLQVVLLASDQADASVGGAVSRLEICGWNVHLHLLPVANDSTEAADPEPNVKPRTPDKAFEGQVQDVLVLMEPLDVVVVMMPSDGENFRVIRAVAQACQLQKRLNVLRVVVQVVDSADGQHWASVFADMPVTELHGDAIDVVVVDPHEATDLLIELAAAGKVVNTAVLQANDVSTTALMALEEGGDSPSARQRHKMRSVPPV
ncbi:hypothetical protein BBJ28_00004147 [Nothophytophthora sp. Chile5]|nr:hypothetical protein BBJ28_00004147 [Nothophytophthora sp. Chile5]